MLLLDLAQLLQRQLRDVHLATAHFERLCPRVLCKDPNTALRNPQTKLLEVCDAEKDEDETRAGSKV